MKKIILVVLLTASITVAFSQTADEVVGKFIEASGGKDKLNSINTLHYNQVLNFNSPMGEIELPFELFKEKNKLFRLQISMQMGAQSMESFTLLTDTGGYIMLPPNPFTGGEGGVEKMEAKEVNAQAFQMDAAGMFPALVDYASKGHKVELQKEEKVDKEDCHKLKLTLNSGQELYFYINKATNLVAKMDAQGAIAASMSGLGSMLGGMGGGGGMDKFKVSTEYKDYKDVEGIKFPTRLIIKTQMGDSQSTITNIQVNKEIDAKWYKPQ